MAANAKKERALALGLERLTEFRADRGPYERWLASEGVLVLFVYEPPAITQEPKSGLLVTEVGGPPNTPWYNPDHEHAHVPAWVNALGASLRGQKLVDAVRRAVRDEPLGQALAAAHTLGGQRAVEALLLAGAATCRQRFHEYERRAGDDGFCCDDCAREYDAQLGGAS